MKIVNSLTTNPHAMPSRYPRLRAIAKSGDANGDRPKLSKLLSPDDTQIAYWFNSSVRNSKTQIDLHQLGLFTLPCREDLQGIESNFLHVYAGLKRRHG